MRLWTIRVWRGLKISEEFAIPAYRLDSKRVKDIIKAILINSYPKSSEEIAHFYLNNRKSKLRPVHQFNIKNHFDVQKKEIGYWCSYCDVIVCATQGISHDAALAVQEFHEQNLKSAV